MITIEDDSDADDDVDIVIIEESDTEDTENTFSTDEILTVETDFQDDSDNSQQPSHLSYGNFLKFSPVVKFRSLVPIFSKLLKYSYTFYIS